MADTLMLAPHLRPVPLKDKGMFFLQEEGGFMFLENPAARVASRIMQSEPCPVEDLISYIQDTCGLDDGNHLLGQMKKRGYLTPCPPDLPPEAAAFWTGLGADLDQVHHMLANTTVGLESVGPDTGAVEAALRSLGIRTGSASTLKVVLTDDFLNPALEDVNRNMLRRKTPWFLVKTIGRTIWLTQFQPGQGCFRCLAERIRDNFTAEAYLRSQKQTVPGPDPSRFPFTPLLAAHRIAIETAQWLLNGNNHLANSTLLTLDVFTHTETRHQILGRFNCPACKPGFKPVHPAIPELQSRPYEASSSGGLRVVPAATAFDRYKHVLDPITGVVHGLKRIPVAIPDCYSYQIRHSLSYRIDSLEALRTDLQHAGGGKGKSDLHARTSALFEGLERYSGVWRDGIYHIQAACAELGSAAVHPNELMLFSEHQYAMREKTNSRPASNVLYVPQPFDPHARIAWIPAYSLTKRCFRQVPASYVYYNTPGKGARFMIPNSNGCASGYCIEEAVLQGLLEIIERDSVSLYWYNRIRRPGVDTSGFKDASYFEALQERYHTEGRLLWVLDVSAYLPAFVAVSRQIEGPPNWILGFGCGMSAEVAVTRAVTELNQMLPAVQMGRPGPFPWSGHASLVEHPYLAPDPGVDPLHASDYSLRPTGDLKTDIQTCIDLLDRQGLEVLVHEQTHPDVGVPVVRVMVPGLYHYWRRLGGRRLREVPVELGWTNEMQQAWNPLSLVT